MEKTDSIEGVPVRFFVKKDSPVYIRVTFKAGARYDQKEGTAHFLEHMLGAGSEKFPSKDMLAEYIENVGGQFSLFTDHDRISLNVQVADMSDIDLAVSLLDEMVNHSLFLPETFEKEKGSIYSEQINKKSNQKEFVNVVSQRLFFQKTDLERSVLGTKESLSSITLEDLLNFKDNYLTRKNMSIIVSGDIDIEKLKTRLLDILPTNIGEEAKEKSLVPINKEVLNDFEVYPSKQVSIVLGFRIKDLTLKDKVCGDICAEYIGVGRASQLIKELRYKRGLVYSVFAYNRNYDDRGVLAIKTDCDENNFLEVVDVIKKTLHNIVNNGISEEKIIFLKAKIEKTFKIKLQTSQSLVENNEKYSIKEYLDTLSQISLNDIQNFITRNIILEEMYAAVCGSKGLYKDKTRG